MSLLLPKSFTNEGESECAAIDSQKGFKFESCNFSSSQNGLNSGTITESATPASSSLTLSPTHNAFSGTPNACENGNGSTGPQSTSSPGSNTPQNQKWIWVLDPLTRKLRVPLNLLVPTQATSVSGTVPSLCIGFLDGRCRHQWCRQAHVVPHAISLLRLEALHAPTCCKAHEDPHDISILTKRYTHIRIVHGTQNGAGMAPGSGSNSMTSSGSAGGGGAIGNVNATARAGSRELASFSISNAEVEANATEEKKSADDKADHDDEDEEKEELKIEADAIKSLGELEWRAVLESADLIPTDRVASTVGLLRYLVHSAPSTTPLTPSCCPSLTSEAKKRESKATNETWNTTIVPRSSEGELHADPTDGSKPFSLFPSSSVVFKEEGEDGMQMVTKEEKGRHYLTKSLTKRLLQKLEKEGRLQILEIPSKCICRLHLSHRCRYLEDCNNIHICREYESWIPPQPNILLTLMHITENIPTVVLNETHYEVTPLSLGDVSDEDFQSIMEEEKEVFIGKHQHLREGLNSAGGSSLSNAGMTSHPIVDSSGCRSTEGKPDTTSEKRGESGEGAEPNSSSWAVVGNVAEAAGNASSSSTGRGEEAGSASDFFGMGGTSLVPNSLPSATTTAAATTAASLPASYLPYPPLSPPGMTGSGSSLPTTPAGGSVMPLPNGGGGAGHLTTCPPSLGPSFRVHDLRSKHYTRAVEQMVTTGGGSASGVVSSTTLLHGGGLGASFRRGGSISPFLGCSAGPTLSPVPGSKGGSRSNSSRHHYPPPPPPPPPPLLVSGATPSSAPASPFHYSHLSRHALPQVSNAYHSMWGGSGLLPPPPPPPHPSSLQATSGSWKALTPTPHFAQGTGSNDTLPVQGITILPSGNATLLSSALAGSGNTATVTTPSPSSLPSSILSTPPSSFTLPPRTASRKHTPPTGGTGGRSAEFIPSHSGMEVSFLSTSPKRDERLPHAFTSGLHQGGRGGAEEDSSSENGSGHARSHRVVPGFSPSLESVSHPMGQHANVFYPSLSSASAETTSSTFAVFSDSHGSTSPAAATVVRGDGRMSSGGKEGDGTVLQQEQESVLKITMRSRRWSNEGEYENVASAASGSTAAPPSFIPEGTIGNSSDTSTHHMSSGLPHAGVSNGFPHFSTSFSSTLPSSQGNKSSILTDGSKGLPPSSSFASPFVASFLAQGADLMGSTIGSGVQDGSSSSIHTAGGAHASQLSSYTTDAATTTTTTRATTTASSYHVQGESGHASQAPSIASSVPKAAVSSLYGLPSSTSLAEPGMFSKFFFSGASEDIIYQSPQYMTNEEVTREDSSFFEHQKVAVTGTGASESRKCSLPSSSSSSFQVDLSRPFQTENIWTD